MLISRHGHSGERTDGPLVAGRARGAGTGRLRARGLDAPPGGADQGRPARTGSSASVRTAAPPSRRAHGERGDAGEQRCRGGGGGLVRRPDGRGAQHYSGRYALFGRVVAVGSVRRLVAGRGQGHGRDGRGQRVRRLVDRSVQKGAQDDRDGQAASHEGGEQSGPCRWARPWRVGPCPSDVRGHAGACRHRGPPSTPGGSSAQRCGTGERAPGVDGTGAGEQRVGGRTRGLDPLDDQCSQGG